MSAVNKINRSGLTSEEKIKLKVKIALNSILHHQIVEDTEVTDDLLRAYLTESSDGATEKELSPLKFQLSADVRLMLMERRKDITFVHLDDIVKDYIHCVVTGESGYSFLKVLREGEPELFLNALTNRERLDCFKGRSIKTEVFFSTLDKLPLKGGYEIYRTSYFGEESGSTKNSPTKVNQFVCIHITRGTNTEPEKEEKILLSVRKNRVDRLRKDVKLPVPYWINHGHQLDETESEIW